MKTKQNYKKYYGPLKERVIMSLKPMPTVITMMNIDKCNRRNISQIDDNNTNIGGINSTDTHLKIMFLYQYPC